MSFALHHALFLSRIRQAHRRQLRHKAQGVVRPDGLCTEGIWKRWQSSPDPKSGGYARATEQGHRPAPFPPDAGAQEIGNHGERLIEAHDQTFCRSAIFPCQKIDDRAKSKVGAHRRAANLWNVSAREISTRPLASYLQPSRTLEAGAVDGSIELPRSASPRQRHSQVAMSAKTCKSQD